MQGDSGEEVNILEVIISVNVSDFRLPPRSRWELCCCVSLWDEKVIWTRV